MNDVLEETIYVMDMPVALTIGPNVRRDVYAMEHPAVASTVVQVQPPESKQVRSPRFARPL